MERAHVVSPNNLAELDYSHVRVAVTKYMEDPRYREWFMMAKSPRDKHIMLDSNIDSVNMVYDDAQTVSADVVFLNNHPDMTKKSAKDILELSGVVEVVVVLQRESEKKMKNHYRWLINETPAGVGIPTIESDEGHGMGRLRWINSMVQSREWGLRRKHYFAGLEDPAEVSIYHDLFSSAINSTFHGSVSWRCFIDSKYGIVYDSNYGLISEPVPDDDVTAGYRHTMQYATFRHNDDLMKGFIDGSLGGERVRWMRECLEWSL